MSRFLEEYEDLPLIDPINVAADQVVEALLDLDRHPDTFLRWPFLELDSLTGPMAPGNVWFVCAASGGGKSTFIASCIDQWQRLGKRVYVMPLETRPKEFRTMLACLATGIHPGDALSGQLRALEHGEAQRAMLILELKRQMQEPFAKRVCISGQRAINLAGLEQGMKEAKAFGADIVIVDHIDHINSDGATDMLNESKRVNDGALRMAQDNDMLLLFTSQLNMQASRGDYLTKFAAPKDEHVAYGSMKRRNATGMIGLYRPVRGKRPDESDEEFSRCIREARAGTINANDALESNVMGVTAMKLRNYGAREGVRISLGIDRGKVYALPERDRWSTAGMYPRRVV